MNDRERLLLTGFNGPVVAWNELPAVCLSGRTYPKLARIVRELSAVTGSLLRAADGCCCCQPVQAIGSNRTRRVQGMARVRSGQCPLPSDVSHGQGYDLGWLSLSGKALWRSGRSSARQSEPFRYGVAVLAPQRAFSSQTPTSRCRSATAGRPVRARESALRAGHAATGTRVALRPRLCLAARHHVRP